MNNSAIYDSLIGSTCRWNSHAMVLHEKCNPSNQPLNGIGIITKQDDFEVLGWVDTGREVYFHVNIREKGIGWFITTSKQAKEHIHILI